MAVTIEFTDIDSSSLDDLAGILGGGSPDKFVTSDIIYALINALTILPTAGIIASNGTSFHAAIAADFPTLNQNTTGSSASCTGNSITASTANALSVTNPVNMGGTGATTAQAAMAALKGVYILGHSAVAASCPADTTEDTLATITVPANAMGANGMLRITTMWTYSNSANTKTTRVRFGGLSGTAYFSVAQTTSATCQTMTMIHNRNATNSQVGWISGSQICFTTSGSGLTTSAIDTTASQTIVITGQKANSGETLTLESYLVELIVP